MTDPHIQLSLTLKRAGYSQTATRQLVFDTLLGQEPLSMADLARHCLPRINRSSLYRTIDLFEQLDIVQRLQIGWKYKLELSDSFQPHHHHMVCLDCGTILTLPENDDIEDSLHAMAKAQGFTPTDHQLEIRGRCAACQTRYAKTTTA